LNEKKGVNFVAWKTTHIWVLNRLKFFGVKSIYNKITIIYLK
jgi:hypothetical protein